MVSKDDRRQDTRAPIELKVEYRRINTFFYDYTKNISRGGTFIKTRKPLPVGTMFLFKLFVPSLAEPLVLRGEVRWIRREGEAGEGTEGNPDEPGMGIRLVYDHDDQRRDIDSAVEKLMVQSLGPLIFSHLRTRDSGEE
jgi:type IV pilus assembly protein PilZ